MFGSLCWHLVLFYLFFTDISIVNQLQEYVKKLNTIILTSRYPSKDNPYSHMFVHTEAKIHRCHQVTVFAPSEQYKQYKIDGVLVRVMYLAF